MDPRLPCNIHQVCCLLTREKVSAEGSQCFLFLRIEESREELLALSRRWCGLVLQKGRRAQRPQVSRSGHLGTHKHTRKRIISSLTENQFVRLIPTVRCLLFNSVRSYHTASSSFS